MYKEQALSRSRKEARLERMTEGFDYSGLKKKYRTLWLCGHCNSLVTPGERHGHGSLESRKEVS